MSADPEEIRLTRSEALDLAISSMKIQTHMVEIANRAHYFAHYLADSNRNTLCESLDCPYQVPLVPSRSEQRPVSEWPQNRIPE